MVVNMIRQTYISKPNDRILAKIPPPSSLK